MATVAGDPSVQDHSIGASDAEVLHAVYALVSGVEFPLKVPWLCYSPRRAVDKTNHVEATDSSVLAERPRSPKNCSGGKVSKPQVFWVTPYPKRSSSSSPSASSASPVRQVFIEELKWHHFSFGSSGQSVSLASQTLEGRCIFWDAQDIGKDDWNCCFAGFSAVASARDGWLNTSCICHVMFYDCRKRKPSLHGLFLSFKHFLFPIWHPCSIKIVCLRA